MVAPAAAELVALGQAAQVGGLFSHKYMSCFSTRLSAFRSVAEGGFRLFRAVGLEFAARAGLEKQVLAGGPPFACTEPPRHINCSVCLAMFSTR
jgi:hypothetical protein